MKFSTENHAAVLPAVQDFVDRTSWRSRRASRSA
jgi:hypothetical protein